VVAPARGQPPICALACGAGKWIFSAYFYFIFFPNFILSCANTLTPTIIIGDSFPHTEKDKLTKKLKIEHSTKFK
jgi:hypothetical protein